MKESPTAALTDVLHGGTSEGESPDDDDDDDVYAMVARVSKAEGLDPSTIVEYPKGVNIVGCKWVFEIKRNAAGEIDKYKARLVAEGYSQVQGVDYDETCSGCPTLIPAHHSRHCRPKRLGRRCL